MMKKLKNIDFKALFINHGEKFGLAFIALIVLLALSTTSWSRTSKSPEDLKTKITAASDKITSAQNVWPAAKAEMFAVINFNGKAQEVFAGVSSAKYEFNTPMFWPLYRKKEKAREPELSIPLYLIADAGVCVLGVTVQPKGMGLADATTDPARTATTEVPDSTLKPVAGGPNPAGPTAGPGPAGAHGATPAPMGIPIAGAMRPPGGPTRPPGGRGPGPTAAHGPNMPTTAVPGMSDMGGASGMTARGKRFVAIRAIVPIKEQIERAMKALNMSYSEASAAIEYTDFFLERQIAIAGPDPWAGKWESVNLDSALEVLRDSTDFDPDPVPSDLQDAVFTMPLPYRLLRYWGDLATHPNIKQFRLSEEEMQRETKLQAKLMEEADKLNLQSQSRVERRGLVRASNQNNGQPVVNDVRRMAQSAMSSQDANSLMNGMASYMNEGANGPRMGAADIKNRLTASGRLYLFRYFDFDVEPGMAYRYRLRLQLRNPNFERPYEDVENESVVAGAYRETGFSNISNPTVVPETVHYFLKDVDRDQRKRPVTSIAMFEWDAKLGTMLADTLKNLSIGHFIAEKKKTMVLDPATPSLKDEEVPFMTEDIIVDAAGDLELPTDQHLDLKLKSDRKYAKVGSMVEALVATAYGDLKKLDTVSEATAERALQQGVDEERKGYLYLKDAPKETGSALDGGLYPGTTTPGSAPMGPAGPVARNPRKRSAGNAPASPYGAAPGPGPVAPARGGGPRPRT